MKQNNLFFHAASSHDYRSWALHNLRLRTVCEGLVKNGDTLCYDPDYVQNICELHPIQLVKTVRMRTRQIAPLLDDPDLNIKLIVLMRDPRAVRSSRNKLKWCSFDACNTLEVVLKYFYISRNQIIFSLSVVITRKILRQQSISQHPTQTMFWLWNMKSWSLNLSMLYQLY